jgi:GH24 family phage-related lysozyme (muramidase)
MSLSTPQVRLRRFLLPHTKDLIMPLKITVTKPASIKLSQPVAPNSAAAPFDVLQVKKSLNRLGHYIPPKDIGITDIPDAGLFTAIKVFQKLLGLPVTGTINPDDKTLSAINAELQKPQKGYYVWNTVGDDRVRGEHEAFEGTIRAWADSPDPGDDFNCRCWAEPAPNATEESYTGWQKEAFNEIKDSEQPLLYPYLDTKGIITIGTGINVDNKSEFMKLDLRIGAPNGRFATQAEKENGYNHLKNFAKQEIAKAPKDSKNKVNKTADSYKKETNLFLSDKAEEALYNQKFKQTLFNDVPKAFPKLSSLPDNAKIVITDMMFNMGATRFTKEKWKNFYEAINNRDWNRAATESHRKDIGYDRNNWARDMLRQVKENP